MPDLLSSVINRHAAVALLYPAFLVMLLCASRPMYRLWKDRRFNLPDRAERKRVRLPGAGGAGEGLAHDMLHGKGYLPVGFLDDNPELKGAKIHGIPLLGSLEDLPDIVQRRGVDVIMIAMPAASHAQMQRVVSLCGQTTVSFRILPCLRALIRRIMPELIEAPGERPSNVVPLARNHT